MVVAWDALLCDALVFYSRLEHHAVRELIDHATLDFLPRRLAWRIAVAASFFQRCAALRNLGIGDHDIGGALVEIDAHAVAGLEQGKPAADRRLRRGVEDGRRARGP